jgi:putative phosphoesterase
MKFAIISDIHANLPALEAVWNDLQQHHPDFIYCCGDLVNFAGWDNEVVDFIRQHNITTVQGNHDEGIGNGHAHFNYSSKTEVQKEFGLASIAHVLKIMTERNREFLRSLPFSIRVEFKSKTDSVGLLLVHGSPSSNNDYIFPDALDDELAALFKQTNAHIIVSGHTHKPFYKKLSIKEGNETVIKHVINAGSAGKPKHGNNKACYTIINLESKGVKEVQFHYVSYDVEKVIDHIHRLGLDNAYDDFLRNGES